MTNENVDRLLNLVDAGHGMYFGEAVTQREHALQCAALARDQGAGELLVAACLLHDIGHLVLADSMWGGREHERTGALFLRELGAPEEVIQLVEAHVPAKRYLTAVDPAYFASLSPASRESLLIQGGPLTPDQARGFEHNPLHPLMLALRRFDDQAKIDGLAVAGVESYRDLLLAL